MRISALVKPFRGGGRGVGVRVGVGVLVGGTAVAVSTAVAMAVKVGGMTVLVGLGCTMMACGTAVGRLGWLTAVSTWQALKGISSKINRDKYLKDFIVI
jgi:hypothetical protein